MHMKGRPTPKAIIRHYWAYLSSVWNGTLWNEVLSYQLWGTLSLALRIAAVFRRNHHDGGEEKTVYLLVSPSRSPSARGPDLTQGCVSWVTQILNWDQPVRVQGAAEIKLHRAEPSTAVLLVTNDWLMWTLQKPFSTQIRAARELAKLGIPIWAALADLYILRQTILTSYLVAFTGGLHLMISNSVNEARRFGIPNPTGPHFWSLPHLAVEPPLSTDWGNKERIAVGSQSGEPRREQFLAPLISVFTGSNYSWRWSHSEKLSYHSYVKTLEKSRIVVAPTFLQQAFIKGPKRYQSKLSATLITGRIWEAFAFGCVVMTNYNQDLEDLGFYQGEHYFVIPSTAGKRSGWALPSDDELRRVASNGRQHFQRLTTAEGPPSGPGKFLVRVRSGLGLRP